MKGRKEPERANETTLDRRRARAPRGFTIQANSTVGGVGRYHATDRSFDSELLAFAFFRLVID